MSDNTVKQAVKNIEQSVHIMTDAVARSLALIREGSEVEPSQEEKRIAEIFDSIIRSEESLV